MTSLIPKPPLGQKKRTKIVATIGPASDSPDMIAQMIEAGVNLFRLNCSHGSPEGHIEVAQHIRNVSKELKQVVGIVGDLPGPKVRIARFTQDAITLQPEQEFVIDPSLEGGEGTDQVVGANYANLDKDCKPGQHVILDDGAIELKIVEINQGRLHTKVIRGGVLKSNKGLNLLGGGLSIDTLTEVDRRYIKLANELHLDYLAVSFPRSAEDMNLARSLVNEQNDRIRLISKIERAEVVASDDNLEAVIRASDAVMVARGDLGVEIGDSSLIGTQKKIIYTARRLNKAVITATQMMESMIENSTPTRAEVFDVANAVLDYTDAVMLSAETAAGKYPAEVVQAMSEIIIGAEKVPYTDTGISLAATAASRVDESIAMAAMYVANHLHSLKAILCLTDSGNTPQWMSRIQSKIPIYAVSRYQPTLNRVTLLRGVYPMQDFSSSTDLEEVTDHALTRIREIHGLDEGDTVLCTHGSHCGQTTTNTLKILTI